MSFFYQFFMEDDEKSYPVVVELRIISEPNYGADADGNRGVMAHFVEIENVWVLDMIGREIHDQRLLEKAEEIFNQDHFDKASSEALDDIGNRQEDDWHNDV